MKSEIKRDYEFLEETRIGRIKFLGITTSLTIALGYVGGILYLIAEALSLNNTNIYPLLLGIYVCYGTYLHIKLSVRRLHDFNTSGWWSLLSLIPLVRMLFWIFLITKQGSKVDNMFGSPGMQLKISDYIFASIGFLNCLFGYYSVYSFVLQNLSVTNSADIFTALFG